MMGVSLDISILSCYLLILLFTLFVSSISVFSREDTYSTFSRMCSTIRLKVCSLSIRDDFDVLKQAALLCCQREPHGKNPLLFSIFMAVLVMFFSMFWPTLNMIKIN